MVRNNSIININSLLNLTVGLYNSDDEIFILNSTLLSLMGKLKIFRAAVYSISNNNFEPLIIKGSFPDIKFAKFKINEFHTVRERPDLDYLVRAGIEYLIPIKEGDDFYALICLGKSLNEIELSSDEIDYINLISAIASNAVRNARTMVSFKKSKANVEQQNQLLSTLFEISKDFSSNFSADRIIKTLALNLMGQLAVTRFAVFTINVESEFTTVANRFDEEFQNSELRIFALASFATKVSEIDDYQKIKHIAEKHSIMVSAPMIVQGNTRGLLLIGRKMSGTDFTEENLMFIEAIGNSAISALENERLFREELEKKRLESELGIALEIQKNLLPDKSPELINFDISGISIPSRHVGGDLYDFIKLDDNKYLIAIADVSGKGIPASLIMANFQAALRVLADSKASLKDIILKINSLLCQNTSADKFVTSFFCIIDDYNQSLIYINAGHNPPFLKRQNGEIEQLKLGGLILGFMDTPFDYEVGEIKLYPNEYLIMYTDGVTEADSYEKIEYGEDRLEQFMKDLENVSTNEVMNLLIHDVRKHLGKVPQNDDITLVVIKGKSIV